MGTSSVFEKDQAGLLFICSSIQRYFFNNAFVASTIFEFGEMVPPLFKSTKPILLPRIVSNPMCISSSSNSSKTLPAGASVCVQSLPNPTLGEYLSGYSLSS